jgi:hypothetical protein
MVSDELVKFPLDFFDRLNFATKLPRGTKALYYRLSRGINDQSYTSHKHGLPSLPIFPNIYDLLTL